MRTLSRLFVSVLLLMLLRPAPLMAQQQAEGRVYLDRDADRRPDPGEPGIPSVGVSNGRQVALTDNEGRWSLPVEEGDILFVIKPAGYSVPLDERNLPLFYRIHKPEGSPDLRYGGSAPTGPLPESVDFPLRSSAEPDSFRVLLFGDPQPYSRQELSYFRRDIVEELAGSREYAFGISLGDLVGDSLNFFGSYARIVSKVGIPWHNVYGNHDMNYDATADRYADESFEAAFGPATYAFNYGQAHFIILDDVVYPRPDGYGGYIGGITPRQLAFIRNDLEHVPEDRLVVVAFHIPPFSGRSGGRTFRPGDRDRLFDILDEYPHTLSLSAHTHTQQLAFYGREEGWEGPREHIHYNVGTTSGDWWSGVPGDRGIPPTLMRDGTPNGYAVLTVEGNGYTFDYRVAGRPPSYRMSMWGPEVVPRNSWHSAGLYVNYFLGSGRTRVAYRVGRKGSWRPMEKIEQGDPRVSALRRKWDRADSLLAGKRPSNPVPSTHLWRTGVPNNLPLGEQLIQVRVTDLFGRRFYDEFRYEVVPPGDR